MPELQLSLIGESATPPSCNPRELVHCEGGCNRELMRSDLHPTPDGLMCEHCMNDLYATCSDCGRLMRFDDWGECDELREGPDGVDRCIECNDRLFARCTHCGRLMRRTLSNGQPNPRCCTAPDESSIIYCDSCWDARWFECNNCGAVSNCCSCFYGPNDECYCEDCFGERYVRCGNCGRAIVRGEHCGWDGDPFCERCFGNADTWKVQPWSGRATSFDRIGSTRRYGVEIETEQCDDYQELQGRTEWGCVYECSTPGKEFVSPILQGDEGFEEIRRMCRFAAERDWTVNRSCGLHIHLDLANDSTEECLRIAYAYRKTYPLWKKFVARSRADNSMCGSPQYSCADIRTFEHIEDFAELRDRFEYVNWRAYIRHNSFEVRLYHGTLNSREICNWIALHARFMDAVKGMTFEELDEKLGAIARTNWRCLCDLIGDPDLLDYWRRKARRQGNILIAHWEESGEPEPEPEPEPEEYVTTGPGHIYVSERAVALGSISLSDVTENGRYPYSYDPIRQAYVVDLTAELVCRPGRPVNLEPIDAVWDDDDDPMSLDGDEIVDIEPPECRGQWCEICQCYH